MTIRTLQAVVIAVLVTLACPRANAEFLFNFNAGGGFASPTIDVRPGESIVVEVLLTQTNSESRLTTDGLVLMDFTVASSNGADVTTVDSSFGPGFVDNTFASQTGFNDAFARVDEVSSDPLGASGPKTDNNSIDADSTLLGTVSYDISATASGSYTLTVSANEDGIGQRVALGGSPFPENITVAGNSLTLHVVAIPEPSGAMLLAAAGVAALVRRRTR